MTDLQHRIAGQAAEPRYGTHSPLSLAFEQAERELGARIGYPALVYTKTEPATSDAYARIGAELAALAVEHPHNYTVRYSEAYEFDVVVDKAGHIQSAERCTQLMNDADALRILLKRRAQDVAKRDRTIAELRKTQPYHAALATPGYVGVFQADAELSASETVAQLNELESDNARWRSLCDDAARGMAAASRDVDALLAEIGELRVSLAKESAANQTLRIQLAAACEHVGALGQYAAVLEMMLGIAQEGPPLTAARTWLRRGVKP